MKQNKNQTMQSINKQLPILGILKNPSNKLKLLFTNSVFLFKGQSRCVKNDAKFAKLNLPSNSNFHFKLDEEKPKS